MPAVPSGIPSFKSALKTVLAARSGLSGVAIYQRWPILPEPEYIWIATARGKQRVAAMRAGSQPREEASIQDVLIHTVKSNLDDETEAANRAFALMAEIEDELRQNSSLLYVTNGGPVRFAELVRYELDEWMEGEQSLATLLLEIDWAKRLDP